MRQSEGESNVLTAEESWNVIHTTVDRARSSIYIAGTASILLVWGVLIPVGYLLQYSIATLAPAFAERAPWFPAPLWGMLVAVGMACSAVIGHRAGKGYMDGELARSAGVRVFLYWLAVVVAAFVIPAIAGMWTDGHDGENIGRISVGVASLGYILFGIMYRWAIAAVGVGIAGAFYIPSFLAGDLAPALSAVAMLVLSIVASIWIRRSGTP